MTYPVIPASEPESSLFKGFWMPDQVRHDGITEFRDGHCILARYTGWLGIRESAGKAADRRGLGLSRAINKGNYL